MHQQSLRVPWGDFAKACGELIEWRAFALWARAIIDAEHGLPECLKPSIDHRCPGFLDGRKNVAGHESIWLDLSAWVDNHVFTAARDGGWLDALHYYSGRDPRSEQIWGQWTRSEAEWRNGRPAGYPPFEEWYREVLKDSVPRDEDKRTGPPLPDHRFADLVEHYIEWEAFAFWIRAIIESTGEVPTHLVPVLEQRCPGFLDQICGESVGCPEYSTWLWRELLVWIEDHFFTAVNAASELDAVRSGARTHLRGERIAEYWAHCSSLWHKDPPASYPGFGRWLQDADAFVVK